MSEIASRITAVSFDTSDLVPVGKPADEESARLRIARNSYYAAGLRAGVPGESDLFRQMLGNAPAKGDFDLENGFWIGPKGQTRGVSSCALVAGQILTMSGMETYWKYSPYVFGTAVSRIANFGRKAGIWKPGDTVLPELGDAILIGHGLREHVAIWISVDGKDVWTVDGGQVDREHLDKYGIGKQAIKHVKRPLSYDNGNWILGDRPLVGYLSVGLAFEKGLIGPGVCAVRREADKENAP